MPITRLKMLATINIVAHRIEICVETMIIEEVQRCFVYSISNIPIILCSVSIII